MDDFIGVTNNNAQDRLRHFTRAMPIGIHYELPSPEVSGHQGQYPISEKNLYQGEGTWETTKEILGWLVDRANFTLQIMR